jgi:hypothetical protein
VIACGTCTDWGSNGGYNSDYCNIDTVDTSIDAAAYYYDSDSEEGIEFFDAGIYIILIKCSSLTV